MKIFSGRLQGRLSLTYLLLASIVLGVAGVYTTQHLQAGMVDTLRDSLLTQARLMRHLLPPDLLHPERRRDLQPLVHQLGGEIGARITVIQADGRVLADSEKTAREVAAMENHRDRPEVKDALLRGEGSNLRYSTTLGRSMLYVALPLRKGGKIEGILRLALPITQFQEATLFTRRAVMLGSLLALGLAAVLGWAVARRLSRPIVEMTRLASCLARGEFTCCRADPEAPGELGELGRALNSLAAQLQQKMQELEQERVRAASVLEGMAEGVVAVNGEGRLVLANPSARRILGLPPEGLLGRSFREVVRKQALWEPLESALEQGVPVRCELTLSPAPLPSRILQFYAAPLGEGEALRGAILVVHDITELRRLEGVRQEFVANVSHELRTPLTSIRGYLETLLEGALEERENARAFLEIAFRHSERMGRLLNDLLELSNLEFGRVSLRLEATSLAEAAEGALSAVEPQAAKKGVALRHEVPEGLPLALADRDRLFQILVNLIDNGVKFTPAGGWVRVKARLLPGNSPQDRPLPESSSGQALEVSVEDTGCGIPTQDLPRLTERFYRVDKARSRELGGTGLGLSIVKHLVQLHGGELAIDSWLDQGTRVRFSLPVAPAA
ncbi:MAG: PAS domain-containing protein [Candidatus Tectomicrobia bacterium]|uniref:histidine kinase n=1 Tax=Tectimicrobiota bacterium TaxID=2528274 RepID=A0A932FYA9_UNCTE|nr:PAS domain-containing protein [Candidatus Tectomicrobia bacterium]